jgi:methylmalonyl-CoA mutase cobalamin-binding domain/chain
MVALQAELENALLRIDKNKVKDILTTAFQNESPFHLVEILIVPVLEKIGLGWENGEYSLSQVYMSGRICEEMVDLILPPSDPSRIMQPKMAIVTFEDYHILGKRIVYSALRASGFEISNFGQMQSDELVERTTQEKVKILLISTLMLPSALHIKQLITRLKEKGNQIKVIVGGAPFNFDSQLWHEVGADGYGASAPEAVKTVRRMLGELL